MQRPFSTSDTSLNGESAAAERLYDQRARALFAYLRLRTATREEAEGLLLDVFLAALARKVTLAGSSAERQRAWLRGVASHKVADHCRRIGAHKLESLERLGKALYTDDALAPELVALDREEAERLLAVLQRLPSLQWRVIHLRFVYGLRLEEIADALGKKEGAARKLLWRALNLVRARSPD